MYYKGKKTREPIGPSSDLHGYGGQIREELSKRIDLERDLRVLDVGTGLAGNAEYLARHLSKGSRIWTLDPSGEVLSKAKIALTAQSLSSKVEFVQGSIDRVDFEDGFFDIVVSVMALHHMIELRPAICEMVRVLRTDGRILLADYKPRAAKELEFRSVHRARDFFTANEVKSVLRSEKIVTEISDFDLWYLVIGRKHYRVSGVRSVQTLAEPQGVDGTVAPPTHCRATIHELERASCKPFRQSVIPCRKIV